MPKQGNNPRLPLPENSPEGNYNVTEGLLTGLIANTIVFAGTWDGEKLVVTGAECTRMQEKAPTRGRVGFGWTRRRATVWLCYRRGGIRERSDGAKGKPQHEARNPARKSAI